MAENICRTVYGAYLQSCLLTASPWKFVPKTTLNEKLNIQAGVTPPSEQTPSVRYLAIGNGGHSYALNKESVPIARVVQHRTTDAALYNQIPFVMRELSNDLSVAEMGKYRLRREETWNNVVYACYYLLALNYTGVAPGMQYKARQPDGTYKPTVFTPSELNLNPTPPALNSDGSVTVSGDYVMVSEHLSIPLTEADITELLNVANIRFGSPDAAIISEAALVSGVDKNVQVSNGANSFAIKEAIVAQVASFISSIYLLQFLTKGLTIELDIGATEPLLNVTKTPVATLGN